MNVDVLVQTIIVTAIVESESNEGSFYKVECNGKEWTCTCPDHKNRKNNCKHIRAVKEDIE